LRVAAGRDRRSRPPKEFSADFAERTMTAPIKIGFLLFPNLTQLDLTGPYEVFARLSAAEIFLIWKNREPVAAQGGIAIVPTTTFAECPQLDLICVPGGPGTDALLADEETLAFVQKQAKGARYVTSVCTGALLLGAAGLLKGKRAATHWTAMEFLEQFGATAVDERVVTDGNVITGGGVTAGVDFALTVVAALAGERVARAIQLSMEYDPKPPFDSGHPKKADPKIVEDFKAFAAKGQAARAEKVRQAAAKFAKERR
jgi:cyclohexyl-isocyanide hydratase